MEVKCKNVCGRQQQEIQCRFNFSLYTACTLGPSLTANLLFLSVSLSLTHTFSLSHIHSMSHSHTHTLSHSPTRIILPFNSVLHLFFSPLSSVTTTTSFYNLLKIEKFKKKVVRIVRHFIQ